MAQYQSSLTGPEIDAALTDMARHDSEAWAVGTRDGAAVSSLDITYHNNAEYYATNAQAAAARAEAAVPSGTAGAVFFDRSQTLTEAQQRQARANIMAGGSNPNLLLNPWFTVNQRGRTSFSTTGMLVDGWRVTSGSLTHTINADGSITIGHGGTGNLVNRVDLPPTALAGKAVTLSIMLGDGSIGHWTVTVPAPTNSSQLIINRSFGGRIVNLYVMASTSSYGYGLSIYSNNPSTDITLRAVKLEIGSVSTLANDAPPDYVSELAKCRYYFQRVAITGSSREAMALGYSYTGGGVFFGLISPMKARPSIARTGTWQVQPIGGTGVNVTSQSIGNNAPYYSVSLGASGITANQVVRLYGDAGAALDFSAEL